MSIILIVEKSDSYADYIKSTYLEEWNVPIGELREITKLNEAGGITLFGDSIPSVITLTTPAEVKTLVADLEKAIKSNEINEYINNGLIVIAKVNRVSTKKLETIVKQQGGTVEALDKGETINKKLLDSVSLTNEVRQFLLDYVGDDFESLIPLVKILKKSPPNIQRKATIESVFLRLPKPPGAVPPWEIETALLRKDTSKMIDVFRRVDRSSSFLVVLSMLKNKFAIAYRIAALQEFNENKSINEITKILKMPNNYYFKKIKELADSYGLDKLGEIMKLLISTEAAVKGRVNVPGSMQMEVALIKLQQLLK